MKGNIINMRIISGKARGTKLYTLDGTATRPTLDRVKESLFNIIQNDIEDSTVLDLFSGSGAIGLEFLSRGAKRAVLCDSSKDAIKIIKQNVQKTHFEEKVEVYNMEFTKLVERLQNQKFDIIYIDPPYATDFIKISLEKIIEYELVNENTKIIVETDDETRILNQIEKMDVEITDKRKYGRATIIFLKYRKTQIPRKG
ncbi:MAG TPA: 16S rRNA (guanine(966)-N(2))-methyltransferase RsmD [Clostridiales bacterium]|jgi:16S rRNA (guanine966-N2)-methyltransferase|nr:16S rRNA (guanine(966)-N(2))-methyltransferase RsmD [Clostridium sp.]MEE1379435.1 16S rRNA (guanine(966)-N(2))-methyltransferase RsmD [Clostridia bacterium]HCQ56228.1 16S rRNA (guanine(966)-N(2))-methyltransferase RsmD [Clostridiales bacterium]